MKLLTGGTGRSFRGMYNTYQPSNRYIRIYSVRALGVYRLLSSKNMDRNDLLHQRIMRNGVSSRIAAQPAIKPYRKVYLNSSNHKSRIPLVSSSEMSPIGSPIPVTKNLIRKLYRIPLFSWLDKKWYDSVILDVYHTPWKMLAPNVPLFCSTSSYIIKHSPSGPVICSNTSGCQASSAGEFDKDGETAARVNYR